MNLTALLRRLPKPRANPQVPRAGVPVLFHVTRLRRLVRLSLNRYENTVVQFNFKASGAAAARPSCMLHGGSSSFQSRRTCSPFSSAKSYRTRNSRQRHSERHPSRRVFRRVPLASSSSSSRAPSTRDRLLGGRVAAAVKDT